MNSRSDVPHRSNPVFLGGVDFWAPIWTSPWNRALNIGWIKMLSFTPRFLFEDSVSVKSSWFYSPPKRGNSYQNSCLVGGLEHFLFSISYMGCHPSHWRTPSFFKMVIAPPTSHRFTIWLILSIMIYHTWWFIPLSKWVSSPQWFQWINPTKIPCKSLGWTYPLTIRGMFATKWYLHLLWFVQIRSPECQVLKGPPWAVPLDLIVTSDSLRKFEGSHRARSGNSAEFSPARPVALLVPMLENHVM